MRIKEIAVDLAQRARDDYQFIDACRRHGILPLLYRLASRDAAFASKFSPVVKEEFERSYYSVALSNLKRREELFAIQDAFASRGIKTVVMKGIAVADTIYHDEAIRPMTDIDLFIMEGDLGRAKEALAALGYSLYDEKNQQLLSALSSELQFGIGGQLSLEVAWDLTHFERFRNVVLIPPEDVFDLSREYRSGPVTLRAMKNELQLITLAWHYFLHGFSRLIWLCDIASLLEGNGGAMDWDLVVSKAGRYRLRTVTWLALYLCRTVMDASAPDGIEEKLAPCAFRKKMITKLLSSNEIIFSPRSRLATHRYLLELALMDGRLGRMKVIFRLVFPSEMWIMNHYRLSNEWLALPLRLAHPFIMVKDALLGFFR